jgi:hypothetical protein
LSFFAQAFIPIVPHAEVAAYQYTQMSDRSAAILGRFALHGAVGCFKPECNNILVLVCAQSGIKSKHCDFCSD